MTRPNIHDRDQPEMVHAQQASNHWASGLIGTQCGIPMQTQWRWPRLAVAELTYGNVTCMACLVMP